LARVIIIYFAWGFPRQEAFASMVVCWIGVLRLPCRDGDQQRRKSLASATLGCVSLGFVGMRKILLPAHQEVAGEDCHPDFPRAFDQAPEHAHCSPGTHVACSHVLPQADGAESNSSELLQRALAIAGACQAERGCETALASGSGQTPHVELTMEKGGCTVWMVQEAGSSVPCVCSEAKLGTDMPLEAVLWSIYSAEERLQWDAASFVTYEALRPASPEPNGVQWDAVYCRMPAPRGLSDRDVVQERFLIRLQQPGGGFAIVMRSPSDGRSSELLEARAAAFSPPASGPSSDSPSRMSQAAEEGFLPHASTSSSASSSSHRSADASAPASAAAQPVRATTVLSAYIVQRLPEGGGVRVTVMSQTDLGGSVPAWAQAMAKKAGKHKFIDWAQRLQAHCNTRGAHDILDARAREMLGNLMVMTSAPEKDTPDLTIRRPSVHAEPVQIHGTPSPSLTPLAAGGAIKVAPRSLASHWFVLLAFLLLVLNALVARVPPRFR